MKWFGVVACKVGSVYLAKAGYLGMLLCEKCSLSSWKLVSVGTFV